MKFPGWSHGGVKAVATGLVIVAGIAAGVSLKWDTSIASLFPADFQSTRDLDQLQRSESSAPFQVVALSGQDESSLKQLRRELEAKGFTAAAGEEDFAPRAYALHLASQSPERFLESARTLDASNRKARLQETRSQLGGLIDPAELARIQFDPFRLAGSAGSGLFRDSGSDRSSVQPAGTFNVNVESTGSPAEQYDDLVARLGDGFGLTGPAAFAVEISRTMERDMQRMLPVLFVTILLLFILCFRSIRPVGLLLLTQAGALAVALVGAAVCFGSMNAIGLGFASILLGIGVDYALLMACAGPRASAMARGVFLSALTTACGFAWLGLSEFPGVRQVGWIVAFGVMGAAAVSVWLARHFSAEPRTPAMRLPEGGRTGLALLGLFIIGGVVLLGMKGLPLDPSAERLAPTQLPAWKAQEQLLPEALQKAMDDLAADYPELAEHLDHNREASVDWPAPEAVRKDLGAAGFGPSWGQALPDVITLLRQFSGGSSELPDLLDTWTAWPRLGQEATREAAREWPMLFLLSFISMLAVLRIGLGRWKVSFLCLGLAASTLVITGGVFSLAGFSMTLISALCLPVVPALAVDYSIHLHLAGRELPSRRELWQRVGLPILISATTSAAGFLALCLSSQPVLANLGFTLSTGIVAALLVNVLALPWLLRGATPTAATTPVHSERLYQDRMFDRFVRVAGWFPRRILNRLAYVCGTLYGLTHPARTGIISRNLGLIDPRLNRFRNGCRTYGNFASGLSDYFLIASRSDREISSWIAARNGKEHLLATRDAGKGGIILSMHHGFFEFGGWLMKELDIPFVVVTNPEPSDSLTHWRAEYRKRWNAETIVLSHDGFSHLQLAEPLRQGKMVALLFDRPHPVHPVPVALPGGMAYFAGTFLHVAKSLGCPLLPGPVLTDANGKYHFEILPPMFVESKGSREETVNYYTQKITDAFLPYLCQYPELWYQFVPLWQPASLSSSSASSPDQSGDKTTQPPLSRL